MSRARLAVLAALAAVNAVLVPFAIRTAAGGSDASDADRRARAESAAAASSAASTQPGIGWGATAMPANAARVLDASAGTVLRAPVTACGPDVVMLGWSADGGQSWQSRPGPATAVLRVRVESALKSWLVGTDSGCRVRLFRSADGGATWQQQPTTDGAWHRMLDPGSRQVHAPKGPIPAPCVGGQQVSDVVGLNPLTAAVLCTGGAVHQTGDGGKTWRLARAAGVLGDALAAPATLYVVEAAPDCAGVQLSRTSAVGWERLGCVLGASADTPLALSFADANNGLLASGSATYLTSDAGRTWRRLGLNVGTSGVARAG